MLFNSNSYQAILNDKFGLKNSEEIAMTPTRISLNTRKDQLTLSYVDGRQRQLSAEYLRVFSPSAEVKGHGPGQEVLQYGKRDTTITNIEKAGHYAIQISFSDGHDSGIYSWEYLDHLGDSYEQNWDDYLQRLHQQGKTRDREVQVVQLMDPRE